MLNLATGIGWVTEKFTGATECSCSANLEEAIEPRKKLMEVGDAKWWEKGDMGYWRLSFSLLDRVLLARMLSNDNHSYDKSEFQRATYNSRYIYL